MLSVVTKSPQPLRITSINHQAYWPLSLSNHQAYWPLSVCPSVSPSQKLLSLSELLLLTIEPIDHQAYWPSSLSTIEPIDHRAYWPSSLSTIRPMDHQAYWPSSLLTSGLFLQLLSLSAVFISFNKSLQQLITLFTSNQFQYLLFKVMNKDIWPVDVTVSSSHQCVK